MIGAIAGDIIGSVYERNPIKIREFPLFSTGCCFTDDSVLTIAVARAILEGTGYLAAIQQLGRQYPHAGYGGTFIRWLFAENPEPYNSWGNGSAMRVSAIGFAFDDLERVLLESEQSARISHNHPEGIKGAQATAAAVFLARTGTDREGIRTEIENRFDYDLSRTLANIRPGYRFDVSCQGSVPEAIIAFLESSSYEDAVRNAISLGGDSDTLTCIAGGIAEAYYGGVPHFIIAKVHSTLTDDLWQIVQRFYQTFQLPFTDFVMSL
ncbi:ADP-ribosylglycohydrolase family protein [bacterium]|nr:ADP-ribosylglycohydrolase family protein [bacterium]